MRIEKLRPRSRPHDRRALRRRQPLHRLPRLRAGVQRVPEHDGQSMIHLDWLERATTGADRADGAACTAPSRPCVAVCPTDAIKIDADGVVLSALRRALHRLRQLRARLSVRRAADRPRAGADAEVRPLLRPHLGRPEADVRRRSVRRARSSTARPRRSSDLRRARAAEPLRLRRRARAHPQPPHGSARRRRRSSSASTATARRARPPSSTSRRPYVDP